MRPMGFGGSLRAHGAAGRTVLLFHRLNLLSKFQTDTTAAWSPITRPLRDRAFPGKAVAY